MAAVDTEQQKTNGDPPAINGKANFMLGDENGDENGDCLGEMPSRCNSSVQLNGHGAVEVAEEEMEDHFPVNRDEIEEDQMRRNASNSSLQMQLQMQAKQDAMVSLAEKRRRLK